MRQNETGIIISKLTTKSTVILLQNVRNLLQNATVITNCANAIPKPDSTLEKNIQKTALLNCISSMRFLFLYVMID